MAKLAKQVDSLDAVPEPFREAYVEQDGKYLLDTEWEDTSGLKSALEKQKAEARAAKEALRKYDGVDPEEFARLKEAAEAAETAKLQSEGKWEDMKKRLQDAHTKELEKYTGEVAKRDRVIEQLTVDNELNAAIDKAGILPEHRKAVKALLTVEAKPSVQWEGDMPRGMMGEVAIGEYVESWIKSDEAAPYLPSSGAGGSGTKGGGGGGGGARKPFKEMDDDEKREFVRKHGQEEYVKHMLATA